MFFPAFSCQIYRTKMFFFSVSSLDPRCSLSLDQGPCRNYTIHWYYDKQANSCAQFWYGGCGGNDNRYETEEECKKTCVVSLRRGGDSVFKIHIIISIWFILNIKLLCSPQDKRRILIWTFDLLKSLKFGGTLLKCTLTLWRCSVFSPTTRTTATGLEPWTSICLPSSLSNKLLPLLWFVCSKNIYPQGTGS